MTFSFNQALHIFRLFFRISCVLDFHTVLLNWYILNQKSDIPISLSVNHQGDIPVRAHYFWPLMAKEKKKGNAQGKFNRLSRINADSTFSVFGNWLILKCYSSMIVYVLFMSSYYPPNTFVLGDVRCKHIPVRRKSSTELVISPPDISFCIRRSTYRACPAKCDKGLKVSINPIIAVSNSHDSPCDGHI